MFAGVILMNSSKQTTGMFPPPNKKLLNIFRGEYQILQFFSFSRSVTIIVTLECERNATKCVQFFKADNGQRRHCRRQWHASMLLPAREIISHRTNPSFFLFSLPIFYNFRVNRGSDA